MHLCRSHWTISVKFDIWCFMKMCRKIQIWLKSGKYTRPFTLRIKYVLLLLGTLNRHVSGLRMERYQTERTPEEV